MIKFILEIPVNERISGLSVLFIIKPDIEIHYADPDFEFMAWGDPIAGEGFIEMLQKNGTPEFIVKNLYGHYYFLYLNKKSGDTIFGNALFSILPAYYHCSNEKITISENAITLGSHVGSNKPDTRFLLETILFNYPLFNNSVFEDISLLPSNSCMHISGSRLSLRKHTEVVRLFEKKPVVDRSSAEALCDTFLRSVEKYFPSVRYTSTLTGGFDSRTLVAAGLYYGKAFSAYSFGTSVSKDITIAETLAVSAGITLNKILLEEEYLRRESLGCGKEFIQNASGTATFARAHYLYAAKKLAADNKYIITGNFGSEIFRAAHVTGPVISDNLFYIFNSGSPGEAFRQIRSSEEFSCLISESFDYAWESLKEDILTLSSFSNSYTGYSRNQRFYVFVFEELFRKYFGSEMVNQFMYLKNRTPYLDIDFLEALLKTELAGIHSGFFEHNPIKRYKGQVLYAHIIKKAYPSFGKMMTDKGYRPDDLMTFSGKARIAVGYLEKILHKIPADTDPNSVARSWETNRDYWMRTLGSGEFLDVTRVKAGISREVLYKITSLSSLKVY